MKDILQAIFEEGLKVDVNANGNVTFGYGDAEFTPAAILQSDPTAYASEFRAWLNDVWLDRHLARLKALLNLHGNRKRFSDLCEAVRHNNIVPLVGSGMSKPSGFPMWKEFLHKLRAYTVMSEADLDLMLNAGQYEEAAERLQTEMGTPLFNERIEHDLRVDDPACLTGAVRLLPELFPNLVLTTNFDDVLECVYEQGKRKLHHTLAGREIEQYRKLHASGRSCLLKLHGDCRRDDGRVLGVKEYDAAYAPGGPQREALALIYKTRPLLWLGCSLTIDRTVKLVTEIAGADTKLPRHYAFLQLPTDDATRVARERELSLRGVFTIWYDGDHNESIEALLVGILYRLDRFSKVS